MTLKDFIDTVNRYDNTIEVRTGNEMYFTVVETLERINSFQDDYRGTYEDRNVISIDATDYLQLTVYID